jgi:AraC-like DNA-binding protein
LQLALEQLAAGATVTETAAACGYSNPSAFVSMFHRELGVTPARYFGG